MFDNFSDFIAFVPIAFTALFPIVNPIGSSVLFLSLTAEADNKLRRNIAQKIALNSFVLMAAVLFLGLYILKIFGISIPVVQLCGGLVLFVMGWKSLNSDEETNESTQKQYIASDVDLGTRYKNKSFYPFTFPFTVGPGTIATTLTISAEASRGKNADNIPMFLGALAGMLLVSIAVYLCYGYADRVVDRLSLNFRKVIMRLLSFILLCIGGQITVNGIRAILENQ